MRGCAHAGGRQNLSYQLLTAHHASFLSRNDCGAFMVVSWSCAPLDRWLLHKNLPTEILRWRMNQSLGTTPWQTIVSFQKQDAWTQIYAWNQAKLITLCLCNCLINEFYNGRTVQRAWKCGAQPCMPCATGRLNRPCFILRFSNVSNLVNAHVWNRS